jgi:hypothetical protein
MLQQKLDPEVKLDGFIHVYYNVIAEITGDNAMEI